MKYKLFSLLVLITFFVPSISNASFLGLATAKEIEGFQQQLNTMMYQLTELQKQLLFIQGGGDTRAFGAVTNPVAGTSYYLAGSGVSSAATSITLTSLTIPQTGYKLQDSDFSNTFYVTLEPGSRTRQEIASCTTVTQNGDGSATLSGCVRGLLPFTPFTASSSYQFSHGGGTTALFSNPPQFYSEFAAKGNNENITGAWTFPEPTSASSSATKNYVDLHLATGAAAASESVAGISLLASQAQTAAGTATSTYGTSTYSLVPQNKFFNSTSSATTTVPVTKPNGKLSQGFLDLSESFTFTNGVTSAGNLTVNGTSTHTGNTVLATTTVNGIDIGSKLSKFGGTGADGDFTATSTVFNLGGANIFVKNFNNLTVSGTSSISFTNPSNNGTVVIFKVKGNAVLTSASTTMIDLRLVGATSSLPGYGLISGTHPGGTVFQWDGTYRVALGGAGVNATTSYGKTAIAFSGAGGLTEEGQANGYGGRGGGGLYMEINGSMNATGTIDISGQVGGTGSGNPGGNKYSGAGGGGNLDGAQGTYNSTHFGGGGGGGAGSVDILYNTLISASSTVVSNGGAGGSGDSGFNNGGAGGSGFVNISQNTEF